MAETGDTAGAEIPVRKAPPSGDKLIELLGVIGSWLVPLVVYVSSIAPCVTAGDAGELVVAAQRFSLPHPPGYPLYMLLLKIWTILPIGLGYDPVAVKCNFFSAVTVILACAIFYRLARSLTGSVAAALGATMILVFSRTFWKFAVVTEVYGLHVLLIMLVLWGLASAREGKRGGLLLTAFAFGLGLAHHHSILLLLPLIFFLWPKGKDAVKVSAVAIIVGFLAPLLLYLLLPVLASNNPMYGGTGFTGGDFVDTITRAEYRQRPIYQDLPPEQLVGQADTFDRAMDYLPKQFGWMLLIVSIAGWFFAPAGKRIWALWSAATVVFWILAVSLLTRGNPLGMPFNYLRSVDEFLIPVNIFLALGFAWLLAPLAGRLVTGKDFSGTEGLNIISPEHITLSILLLFCVPAVFLGYFNWKASAMTHHTFAQDQARNVLEQISEDTVLVVSGDESFIFEYLQEVRGIRTDVELVVYPFAQEMATGGGRSIVLPPANALAYFVDEELGDRPCVFTFSPPDEFFTLLDSPKALRIDGVALTLVDREPVKGDYFYGDPNVWTSYQLRNLDPQTLAYIVPDDFEYETLARYARTLRLTVMHLDATGYGEDPSRDLLWDMANFIDMALSKTDYPTPPPTIASSEEEAK